MASLWRRDTVSHVAARVSGYTADHLGALVKRGKIPNAGRTGAPRIRRQDVPRKKPDVPHAALSYALHTDFDSKSRHHGPLKRNGHSIGRVRIRVDPVVVPPVEYFLHDNRPLRVPHLKDV